MMKALVKDYSQFIHLCSGMDQYYMSNKYVPRYSFLDKSLRRRDQILSSGISIKMSILL